MPHASALRHSDLSGTMRLPLVIAIPLLLTGILADWYICHAIRQRCTRGRRFWFIFAVVTSVIFGLGLLTLTITPKKTLGDDGLNAVMWCLFTYISVYVPKYLYLLFDLAGKIPRLWQGRRLKWFGRAGVLLGVVFFGALWWGASVDRYRIDVKEPVFVSNALPDSFDGLRLVQFSDLHIGTFGTDTAFVTELVERINSLHPDIIVFTGDIVNRHSDELEPFVGVLSHLYAPLGVYSVLGNHDYGDYYRWESAADKALNQRRLEDMQSAMGWTLLNNSTELIVNAGDTIALIGVENIGDPPFPTYGDLDDAYPGDLDDGTFKILLSHNPAHWEADIADSPDKNIALTLAGHTHAMQIEVGGWSPAAWRYRYWGGMYADADSAHHLYVNIGSGEVGVPARIGACPEITLFTLKHQPSLP